MKTKKIIFILSLLFLSVVYGESEYSLRAEIAKQRAELAEISDKEEAVTAVLDGLSREITLVGELVDSLSAERSVLNKKLEVLAESLSTEQIALDSARAAQTGVLRQMYIRGRGGDWAFLLSGNGLGEFVNRLGYFIFLAEERLELSESIARKTEAVEVILDSTKTVKNGVEEIINEHRAELDSLEKAGNRKRDFLDKIRKDKAAYQKAISEMEKSLAELTRRLPETSMEGNFERFKGALPWPTHSTGILHPFGLVTEKRYGTRFKNAGIDISTEPEEPVQSVAPGRIAQVYWLRGYGRIVIIEHPGGFFSVYGNLGSVDVNPGDEVASGQRIGRTSSDGWLEGAKLHFEIRKGKQEVNPVEWLASA